MPVEMHYIYIMSSQSSEHDEQDTSAQQAGVSWTGVPQAQLQEVLELPRQSTQSAGEDDSGPAFVWSKHWYPVCLEANLSKEAPNKITLLVSVCTVYALLFGLQFACLGGRFKEVMRIHAGPGLCCVACKWAVERCKGRVPAQVIIRACMHYPPWLSCSYYHSQKPYIYLF